jgi:hypothetical protein
VNHAPIPPLIRPMKRSLFPLAVAALLALTGCDAAMPSGADGTALTADLASARGDKATLQHELARARAATARYHHVEAAEADGYVDIDLYIPNMGYHYLNLGLLEDGVFDVERPELLVYADLPNGKRKLVAVEYATPRDPQNPPPAPDGFTGGEDEWSVNTDFDLWTLHAWVWMHNPDGVFAPMNPLVP